MIGRSNMIHTLFTDSRLSSFVEQRAEASFYHDQAWLDLISKLYGYSVISLTTTNSSGQISGFLPLCFMYSRLTGRRLVALPFSDHCPILAEDEASANELIDQAILLARKEKVQYLELRSGNNDLQIGRAHV